MPLQDPLRLLTVAFEARGVMLAVLDKNMNFLRVNRVYAEKLGKQEDHFIGKNYFTLYPDPEKEAMFARCARYAATIRHRAKTIAGDRNTEDPLRCCEWTISPARDGSGEVVALILSAVDVTHHINTIDALDTTKRSSLSSTHTLEQRLTAHTETPLSSSEFTEAVVNTVGSLVIVLDTQGRIVRFNHACEVATGYRAQEILGCQFWDLLLLEEDREPVKRVFEALRRGRVPSAYENYWLTKDGYRRWIAWTNTALRDAQGNVTYIVGAGVDMTERRLADAALRQSEQQFRLLAENINEMFWLASPDRTTMYYVSPAFESIWGRPCSDIYANPMTFLETTPDEDRARILADHAEQAKGHFKESYELEFRIRRPNGELRWIASRYVPVRDETGHVFRVAGVSADITERKQAEEQRVQSERVQRDALVREVHHRIKNTLQGVVGLLRQSASHPQFGDTLRMAISQVTAVAVVHGLQSKAGGEAIFLCEMCEAIAANIMAPRDHGARLQVTRHLPATVAVAADDAVPLALVINELMFNALKHSTTSQSAPIRVDIDADTAGVVVRIRNRGAQLPEGLDIMRGVGIGTGLGLVRTLLPKGASVALKTEDDWTETELRLGAPAVRGLPITQWTTT